MSKENIINSDYAKAINSCRSRTDNGTSLTGDQASLLLATVQDSIGRMSAMTAPVLALRAAWDSALAYLRDDLLLPDIQLDTVRGFLDPAVISVEAVIPEVPTYLVSIPQDGFSHSVRS